VKDEKNMKEKGQKKNSVDINGDIKPSEILKTYFSMIVLTHKNVGALRMAFAYVFIIFALICFWFTIAVPVTSEFKQPTTSESLGSRLISGGMMIANLFAYSIIMTWKRIHPAPLPIRIAFIALVFYINISLIGRIAYQVLIERNFL